MLSAATLLPLLPAAAAAAWRERPPKQVAWRPKTAAKSSKPPRRAGLAPSKETRLETRMEEDVCATPLADTRRSSPKAKYSMVMPKQALQLSRKGRSQGSTGSKGRTRDAGWRGRGAVLRLTQGVKLTPSLCLKKKKGYTVIARDIRHNGHQKKSDCRRSAPHPGRHQPQRSRQENKCCTHTCYVRSTGHGQI